MKQQILNNLKNIYGWNTKRKIVVISVDDYGNVRLDSKSAREKMDKAGLKVLSRFDAYDTLENTDDLDMLYEVLSSIKDKNGRHAVFTPFALPANINFEKMHEVGNDRYIYELLPETYSKLEIQQPLAYKSTWKLWKEGIDNGLMRPQFHGREHLNLKVFSEKLNANDFEVLTALANRSYTSLSSSGYKTIRYTAAFEFDDFGENEAFPEIISTGLDAFEKVYGYKSVHFNPPGGRESIVIHKTLVDKGIKFSDTPLIKKEHQGKGSYKRVLNFTGKINESGLLFQVRNVVFEPTHNRGFDWVEYSLSQIEAAFRWNKPAIISSHRVNYCGHIDPNNREVGISALKQLLSKIVERWPDVEFMSSDELGNLMSEH